MLKARTTRVPSARRAALLEAIEPRRLMSTATLDAGFGTDGYAFVEAAPAAPRLVISTEAADGKIVTASFAEDDTTGFFVNRMTPDGGRDPSFNGGNGAFVTVGLNPIKAISDVVTDASGQVFVGVIQTDADGRDVLSVARVGSDGQNIGNFGGVIGSPGAGVGDLDLVVSGNSVRAVYSDQAVDNNVATIVTLDATTGLATSTTTLKIDGTLAYLTDALLTSDGTLALVGGAYIGGNGTAVNHAIVGRVSPSGTSASWSMDAVGDSFQTVSGVATPDGGVVVAGLTFPAENVFGQTIELVKFGATGSLEAGFGTSGHASPGTLDFQGLGSRNLSAVEVDADGLLYVSGLTLDAATGGYSAAVVRLTAGGAIDASFDGDGMYVSTQPAGYNVAFGANATADGGLVVSTISDGPAVLFKLAGSVAPPVVLPFTVVGGRLSVVAGDERDEIVLSTGAAGGLTLTINGVTYAIADAVTGISIDGGAGDDLIKVSTAITTPATLIGGAGNDTLRGGSGDDVLLGGDGDDAVIGRDGQDFIVGGAGKDYMIGREDADVLISGTTTLDLAGIAAVMAEWTSGHTLAAKVLNLTGLFPQANRLNAGSYLQPGVTMFNDNAIDTLSGGEGTDFAYASLWGTGADVIRDNLSVFRADVSALITTND